MSLPPSWRSIPSNRSFVLLLLIHMLESLHRLITLLLVCLVVSSPIAAQQRRNTPPKKPVTAEVAEPLPTFDTLLSADSYRIYCEVRAVGGLIRSSAVNDLLEPVMKLGGPPKEFRTVVRWLNAHADVLAGSRMLVAGWPSRPNLPNVLLALEFSSSEEAKKFYPELRGFIPKLFPTPTPTPLPATMTPGRAIVSPAVPENLRPVPDQGPPPPPLYHMKQAGTLIFISDTDFTFLNLRPRRSKPLEEDQNFTLTRNRFASESLFLYIDTKSIDKEQKERQKKAEEEFQKRIESEAANQPTVAAPPVSAEVEASEPPVEAQPPPPQPEPSSSSQPTLVVTSSDAQASSTATLSSGPQSSVGDAGLPIMFSLYGALFGGEGKWPEAIGVALAFEGDAYVLRTLMVNGAESKSNVMPFGPQFAFGPPLVPDSPNIFPVDADLFASLSLDYPQTYDGMLKAMAHAEEQARKYRSQNAKAVSPPESPFATYEKKLGLKIKDDLLPLLGNEIALVLLKKMPSPNPVPSTNNPAAEKSTPEGGEQKTVQAAEPNPVLAISIKDREAVARLIPKIIESFGLKGANLIAQTEKREGTEITSYANAFAYAFIGDFLVVSADPAATRRVVDAFLNHQTLSSNSHFRNFTRWQPRQVLGQVYVAPGLVEQYTSATGSAAAVNEKVNEFVARVNPVIDPLTYAITNDGQGPLHELHVPKNLLQLLIAGWTSEAAQAPARTNEAMAKSSLRTIAVAEATYQATKGDGHFGSLDELIAENLVSKDMLQKYGYRIEVTVSEKGFEATAIPIAYGESGRLSYFIDETSVLRAGDHGGGAATVADQPAQ